MPKYTYGSDVKARVKRLLEALLAFVNWEFEGNFDIESKWEAEESANPKVIFKTTLVTLELLTAKDKYPDKLTKPQIREALNLLKDFLKILEDNRTKTKGSDDWHFTLTLWSKDKEKNLKQFDKAWEDSRPKKSKALATNSHKSDEFDWRDICDRVLATQQLRRQATAQQYELNIYVPLGLMERPKTPNPRQNPTGEDSRSQKEPELQIVQTYKDDAFFQKVIAENRTEKGKHIAIIGEPGAGKTTLLGELAEQLPKNSPDFPICIRLADLRESTIEDYLLDNWLKKALQFIDADAENVTPEIRKALKQLFRQGKVWLLLDAVDEMAAESPVQALAKIREQLTDWVGKARVVLTCRLNIWDATISNTLTNFDTYKTLEFEPDDVDEFICQWFEQASQDEKRRNSGNETFWREQGKRLQQQLKEPGKDNIRRMVRNPLRLSMLCQSWCVPEQDLPETKAALYKQFTTYFFEWKLEEFQKKHRVLKETDKKQIQQALAKLALAAMESTNRFRIGQEFAIEQMEEEWFDLADELGWLVLVDRYPRTKKPVYSFFHPTFQEYFAACAVDEKVDYWDFFLPRNHIDKPVIGKRYRIFEPQWKEVILLWLGRHEEQLREHKKEFIKALVEFDNGIEPPFYWYRAIFLAAAGIAEFTDDYWVSQIVPRIVALSFGVFNSEQDRWMLPLEPLAEVAKFALLETERTKTIEILLDLIKKSNQEDVYFQILTILKKIGRGNLNIIDFLETNIAKIKNQDLRTMVAETLGEINIGNETAISNIIEIIKISLKPVSIEFLASKLQIIGINNTLCINSLEELLKDKSQSKEFHRIIGTALWSIDKSNQTAITLLVNLAKDTQYSDRWRTFEIISQILAHTNNEEIISTLQSIVRNNDDKDEFAKILALKILLLIPDINENIFNDLINLVQGTAESYIQYKAIKILNILAHEKNEKVLKILEDFLGTKNDYLRYISAYTICNIENNKAIAITTLEHLIMNAKDNKIRCQAAYCLAKNNKGSKVALTILEEFAQKRSFDDNFRSSAAIYLIKLFPSNDVAIKTLEELSINSPNERIRIYAAINLGYFQIENSTAIESLFWVAKNSTWELIQGMATKELGDLGLITKLKLRVINTLVDLLRSNKSGTVCKNAADGLKSFLNLETRKLVIADLKHYISKQTYINDFGRFYYCYEIVWHCVQNMPYPDFYQAWHQDNLTNSTTSSLNLVNLPQDLAEAINDRPDLCNKVKLICIDSYKFGNRENPATKIYNEMRLQGCDKSEDGKPKTMAELQDYWDELRIESEIPLFFICYDSTALSATPAGFSDPFLKALSKFDRAICVVCEPGDIPLQTFSPQQKDLVGAIVQWIEKVITEN
jgi:HEAT repeat protein/energy-coupling factor transporter ATP-binding protein EcfA2